MSFLTAAVLTIFILILFLGLFLNLFGLPGSAVIFLDVLLYAVVSGFQSVGLKTVLFLLFSALVAEAIEFYAVADEKSKPIYSGRAFRLTAIGAIMGALALTPFFWGPGTWFGFFLGGLTGFLVTEIIRQQELKPPHRTLRHALLMITGKNMVKGLISLCMIAVALVNIYS